MCTPASSGGPATAGSAIFQQRDLVLDSHTSDFHAAPSGNITGKRALGWSSPSTALWAFLLLLPGFNAPFGVQGATFKVEEGGPISTIQEALDMVQPGDTIKITNGNWFEDVKTMRDGTASNRITIKGNGGTANRENVVVRGAGTSTRVFEVRHDYYILKDFTIDGKVEDEPVDQDEYNDFYRSEGGDAFEDAYRDKLLYISSNGEREPTIRDQGYRSAVDGVIVKNMVIRNAGGECIRLRDFVTNADINRNEIMTCGLYDYEFGDGGKNGEGVYIGTSDNQWGDGKNFSDEPDQCRGNVVRNNLIVTNGNEGVEVKDGSVSNVIKDNEIYMQLDVDSGGISSNGDKTIIKNNFISHASGAGVRLGGVTIDGVTYGVNSQVFGNTMEECMSYGVKIMMSPQKKICGNDITLPPGKEEDEYQYSGGTFADDFADPREPC